MTDISVGMPTLRSRSSTFHINTLKQTNNAYTTQETTTIYTHTHKQHSSTYRAEQLQTGNRLYPSPFQPIVREYVFYIFQNRKNVMVG